MIRSDISMCQTPCPSATHCLRQTATPDPERQVYSTFALRPNEVLCDSYLPDRVKTRSEE